MLNALEQKLIELVAFLCSLQAGHNLQPVELPQADHGDLPLADQPQAVHPGNIVADVPQGHLPENPPVELPEAGHGDLPDAGLPQAVQPGIGMANLPQGHLPGPENPPVELPDAGQPQVVQPGMAMEYLPQGHQLGQLPENHDGRVINGKKNSKILHMHLFQKSCKLIHN